MTSDQLCLQIINNNAILEFGNSKIKRVERQNGFIYTSHKNEKNHTRKDGIIIIIVKALTTKIKRHFAEGVQLILHCLYVEYAMTKKEIQI